MAAIEPMATAPSRAASVTSMASADSMAVAATPMATVPAALEKDCTQWSGEQTAKNR
jgi:hypothetical protein